MMSATRRYCAASPGKDNTNAINAKKTTAMNRRRRDTAHLSCRLDLDAECVIEQNFTIKRERLAAVEIVRSISLQERA
jgi:hypothetical protein